MTDDEIWEAWVADYPEDADYRAAIEGTLGYQVHRIGSVSEIARAALRKHIDGLRDRALVRALRATGDHDLADRIEGKD